MKKVRVFIQDCPPYNHTVLVCSGVTSSKQIEKVITTKKVLKWVKENGQVFADVLNNKKEALAINHDKFLILILKPYKNDWQFWDTLLHELNHIVFLLSEMKMLQTEMEAQAYLHEYLFREIRRKFLKNLD